MRFDGRARVFGDDINTDYIISSARKRETIDASVLKRYLLETVSPDFAASIAPGDVIVAGRNFGCGSAMEVAATVIQAAGIRAVLARSFARSFYRNALNNGLLALECDTRTITEGDRLSVEFEADRAVVQDLTRGEVIGTTALPAIVRALVQHHGLVGLLRSRQESPADSGADAGSWLCVPCVQQLLVVREREFRREWQVAPSADPLAVSNVSPTAHRLPSDETADDAISGPPLSFRLSDAEVATLVSSNRPQRGSEVAAGTILGPDGQDKTTNEDFALATRLLDPTGQAWVFGAVADGVSTGTFFAARASRLACLIAFRLAHALVARGGDLTSSDVERFKADLATALSDEFDRDRRALLALDDPTPRQWSPEVFGKHKDRTDFWYNSTLLVACLGPAAGFVLWAGDGAIELHRTDARGHDREPVVLLHSSDDVAISHYVSSPTDPGMLSTAFLGYDPTTTAVRVYLASDGVDRTFRRLEPAQRYADIGPADVSHCLQQCAARAGAEPDNMSLVRLALHLGHR